MKGLLAFGCFAFLFSAISCTPVPPATEITTTTASPAASPDALKNYAALTYGQRIDFISYAEDHQRLLDLDLLVKAFVVERTPGMKYSLARILSHFRTLKRDDLLFKAIPALSKQAGWETYFAEALSGPASPKGLRYLELLLRSKDPQVRWAAAEALFGSDGATLYAPKSTGAPAWPTKSAGGDDARD